MKWIGKHKVFQDLMIGSVLLTPPDSTYEYELTLPNDDGTAGQVLTTDGNGVLSWVTNSAGGTGVSMTNGVNNRVMTATAAQDITGEADLTFDGSTLSISTARVLQTYTADGGTDFGYLMSASSNEQDNATLAAYANSLSRSSNINAGQTTNIKGFYQTVDDYASGNVGDSNIYGLHQIMSFSGTGGNTASYGINTTIVGGDLGNNIGVYQKIADGGLDLKFVSYADIADYFSLATGASGETTLTTVDGGGAAAHLNFNVDGLTKFTSLGVEIENDSAAGAHALIIDNNDVDQNALLIEAANTTGHILDIEAGALTTADAIHVKADALTTGAGLHLDINDTVTTSNTKSLIKLDYDRTGVAALGQLQFPTGLEISMTDTATNIGFVNMKGIDINMDHSSTGGLTSSIGIDIDMNGGDATTGMTINAATTGINQVIDNSTGKELDFRSSANLLDSFVLTTGTNAETTLTTVDWDAALAHFNVVADGNIVLDAVGDIELNADGGNITFKDGAALHAEFTFSTPGLNIYGQSGDTGQLNLYEDSDNGSNHINLRPPATIASNKIIDFPDTQGTVALTSDIPTDTVTTGTHIHTQTKVTLDAAACTALNSAPQTLVAAQGANTIIVPVSVTVLADRNSADSSGADLIVGYNNTTNYQLALRYMRRFMLGITTDMQFNMAPFFAGHGATSLTGGTDVPLTISTSAAITGGSMTSMVIYTSYYVIDNS